MFLGASKYRHKKYHNFNKLYNVRSLPPFINGVALTPEVQLIFYV